MKKRILMGAIVASALLVGCGGGGVPSNPAENPTSQDLRGKAIAKIKAYSENNNSPVPTVEDYAAAGVVGVSSENIDKINQIVSELDPSTVDTSEKIQKIISDADVKLAPTVEAGSDIQAAQGDMVTLSAKGEDLDGKVVSYSWTEEGNELSSSSSFDYDASDIGLHTLVVTVVDNDGLRSSDSLVVNVGNGGGSTYTIHPYDAPAMDQTEIDHFMKVMNDARAVQQDCGTEGIFPPAPPLKWNEKLYSAAYEHSVDMAHVGETSEDIDHVGSGTETDWTAQVQELENSSPWDRGKNSGYDDAGHMTSGENIHSSPETIEVAMEDWLESDHHCSNFMNPNHSDVAVAVVENTNARWQWYWTQLFGQKF